YDCDTGIDDALAILLGVMGEKVDFLGITTVAGNSDVKSSTENTLRVLNLLQEEKSLKNDVPVYKGADHPLEYEPTDAKEFHGSDGMGDSSLPRIPEDEVRKLIQNESASEFIVDSSTKYKGITIVTTGPLTNLAIAISSGELNKENIEEVIVMGGAINEPGNITISAEFNIYVDPHAANIVFNSGLPITLVPLDVTHKVMLTPYDLETFFPVKGKVTKFVHEIVETYQRNYIAKAGEYGCPLHDPLAMGICTNKGLVFKVPMYVLVVENSESKINKKAIVDSPSCELIRGQTIAERRKGAIRIGIKPNVDVCINVKSQEFIDYFIRTLTR
ncbi:nucleoside hydrolase, partial [Dehalococcoidia bacterium]|nr:nucleoside hydrolase [Dehalococcoidia bacterium]